MPRPLAYPLFLQRQGHQLDSNRPRRLWHQAAPQLPRRRSRRRIAGIRPRPLLPHDANVVRTCDFVFDVTASGRQIKSQTMIDEFTRECLTVDVAGSLRSKWVIRVLSESASVHEAPLFSRSDNGPELISRTTLGWVAQTSLGTALIDPGRPRQNCRDESFDDRLRDECLGLECFRCRDEAPVAIEIRRSHHNAVRPHGSLNDLSPYGYEHPHHPILNRAALQE